MESQSQNCPLTFKNFMINEELHSYSSTQFNLPDDIGDEIIEWCQSNISDSSLYEDPEDSTFGREYEPHVTVLYGLHANKPDEIKNLLNKTKSFPITLGKISLFTTSDKFDVIKIEVKGEKLHELNKLISKLPHTNKFPEYKPHITLAYIKKGKCKNLINNQHFEGKTIKCDNIAFSDKDRKKTTIQLK